jgi:hypothetical protein
MAKKFTQRHLSDNAKKYLRQSTLRGISELYRAQSIPITAPRFGKHWTQMDAQELLKAYEYVSSVLSQSPKGSNWADMEFSPRIVASTYEGAIWTVNIGFPGKVKALNFANDKRVQGKCILSTQPRKGKRTNCPWEVKLWSPDNDFLYRLAQRELAQQPPVAA